MLCTGQSGFYRESGVDHMDEQNIYSEKKLGSFVTTYRESMFSKPQDIDVTITATRVFGVGFISEQIGTKEGDPEYKRFFCNLDEITKVYINTNSRTSPIYIQCDENNKGVINRRRVILPSFRNNEEIVSIITSAKADIDKKAEKQRSSDNAQKRMAIEEEKLREMERRKKAADAEFESLTAGFGKPELPEAAKKLEQPHPPAEFDVADILGIEDIVGVVPEASEKASAPAEKEIKEAPPEEEAKKVSPKAPAPPEEEAKKAPPKAPAPPEEEAKKAPPKAPAPPEEKAKKAPPKAPAPPEKEALAEAAAPHKEEVKEAPIKTPAPAPAPPEKEDAEAPAAHKEKPKAPAFISAPPKEEVKKAPPEAPAPPKPAVKAPKPHKAASPVFEFDEISVSAEAMEEAEKMSSKAAEKTVTAEFDEIEIPEGVDIANDERDAFAASKSTRADFDEIDVPEGFDEDDFEEAGSDDDSTYEEAKTSVRLEDFFEPHGTITLDEFQDVVKKLKSALDNGEMTKEEFAAEKAKLMRYL